MLSKIKNYTTYLGKNILKHKHNVTCVLVVLLLIAIVTYGYIYYTKNTKKENFQDNNEINTTSNNNNNKKTATLYLFSADWCPHCKKAEPEWNAFYDEYNDKEINGYIMNLQKINCTNETTESRQLMTKYNVEGFPTVIMVKDGETISFDAPVKTSTLTQFCYTML
jgi:thiol-disulfide isomerase/thioredoxin